ncbi:MAG TPA: hypothetical protein DCS22_07635 [Flavobacteriaceae bacterium]|nr:hypothetical protein [Flavobacteriaceae bacterium]|tara:strand:- start:113 stop:358 length:246 start_codon:yes stop_codon:yes gene_type:complete
MSSLYADDAETLISLWISVKQFITAKEREDAAESFLKAAEEIYNVEDMVNELSGSDSDIDKILSTNYMPEEDEEDEDEEFE